MSEDEILEKLKNKKFIAISIDDDGSNIGFYKNKCFAVEASYLLGKVHDYLFTNDAIQFYGANEFFLKPANEEEK